MEDVVRETIEIILIRRLKVLERWNENCEDKTSEEFRDNVRMMKLIDDLLEVFL
jgi:hypothetical protein